MTTFTRAQFLNRFGFNPKGDTWDRLLSLGYIKPVKRRLKPIFPLSKTIPYTRVRRRFYSTVPSVPEQLYTFTPTWRDLVGARSMLGLAMSKSVFRSCLLYRGRKVGYCKG